MALRYDFRTRFHIALDAVPDEMGWDEARDLVQVLTTDPSTALAAALAGWSHPMSREALILADLFDVQHMSKAKKRPAPYPRPWATDGATKTRKGNAGGRSRAEVVDILRRFGHDKAEVSHG